MMRFDAIQGRIEICLFLLAGSFILSAQLPDVTFQNINIWPTARDGNSVRFATEDNDGFLWLGTTTGAYRYDGHELHTYWQTADTNSLNGLNITEMYIDHFGTLWFGTADGGLNKYVPELDHFERVIEPEGMLGAIHSIIVLDQNTAWIGCDNGLFLFDFISGTLKRFVPNLTPRDPRGYSFRFIVQDPSDANFLWIGGLEGPYRFSIMDGVFEYHPMPFGLIYPDGYMMMDMHFTNDDQFWSGSWGGGLLSYDISDGKWNSYKTVDTEDGRWRSIVLSSLPDVDGHFWVATSTGFGKFNSRNHQFDFYTWDERDPRTIDSSFHYSGIARTSRNNIVVTRMNGFSISSPLNEIDSTPPHPPGITNIEVDAAPLFTDTSMFYVRKVHMKGDDKDVSFKLCTPGIYSSHVELSYMLEGYDKAWITLNEGHSVRYTNLPGGHHKFRYRVSLDNENWLEGTPVIVVKSVHFWQTSWFLILMSLLTVSIIAVVYWMKVRNIKRELLLQSEFDIKAAELELKALRSQMNPHFMFNSLNSIKHYILTNEPLKASEYLTNFATLIRTTLHNSAEKLVPLSQELETLLLYIELEQLRFKNKFEFRCTVQEGIDTNKTVLPPLILQPYVENAIWHGLMHKKEAGTLTITISRQNGAIECIIEDNGVGRGRADQMKSKSATNYKSMGMGITQNRIDLHNRLNKDGIKVTVADIMEGSGEVAGTRVIVSIPQSADVQRFNA